MLCEDTNSTAHILLTTRDNLIRTQSPGIRAQAQESKHKSPGTRAQVQEPRCKSLHARGARFEKCEARWMAAGCWVVGYGSALKCSCRCWLRDAAAEKAQDVNMSAPYSPSDFFTDISEPHSTQPDQPQRSKKDGKEKEGQIEREKERKDKHANI